MNAYELSKLLEVDSWYKLVTREEIANMLCQQADRIKELETELTYTKFQVEEATKMAVNEIQKRKK